MRAAIAGLAQANVNVLNGADGLAEMAAGLLTQGVRIYDSVRSMRDGAADAAGGNGAGVDGSSEMRQPRRRAFPRLN